MGFGGVRSLSAGSSWQVEGGSGEMVIDVGGVTEGGRLGLCYVLIVVFSILLTPPYPHTTNLDHKRNVAIVRPPPPNFAEGLVTHFPTPTSTSYDIAHQQWEEYCKIFEKYGWDLKVLGEARVEGGSGDHCPDSVFVEDTAVLFKDDLVGEVREDQAVIIIINNDSPPLIYYHSPRPLRSIAGCSCDLQQHG